MTDQTDQNKRTPGEQAPPSKDIEKKVKRDPADKDARVDLGSDESMDASDPSSATQPDNDDQPAPSSGFPE
nr:hypothetical protein [uncultured Sphingomonas sp.]